MQLESSVTLFDDNKVESKFAQLEITADGITSEVSRKVGNDEVISRINQSAEAVTIDASKVNINGVITAINNNTTTTIDGDKITTGSVLASAIKANSGYFNIANIPDLSAAKIRSGTIDTERLNISGIISAINSNGTTTIDGGKITTNSIGANKIKVSEITIGAAQIGSGTIDSARIPNLDASKITTGTISASRILGVGASNGYHMSIGNSAISFLSSSSNVLLEIQARGYYADLRKGNGYVEIMNEGASLNAFESDTKNAIITASTVSGGGAASFYLNGSTIYSFDLTKGMYIQKNGIGIYLRDADPTLSEESAVDVLRIGSTNSLVLGRGMYTRNKSGYDTYIEGYNVVLVARNKYYLNSTSGTQITSDRRMKRDIVPLDERLKKVFMSLQPVEYRAEKSLDRQKHFGFIAQDVEKAFYQNDMSVHNYSIVDEFMPMDSEERIARKSLCYTEFIPLCVQMIQSQQRVITRLEEKINAICSN